MVATAVIIVLEGGFVVESVTVVVIVVGIWLSDFDSMSSLAFWAAAVASPFIFSEI